VKLNILHLLCRVFISVSNAEILETQELGYSQTKWHIFVAHSVEYKYTVNDACLAFDACVFLIVTCKPTCIHVKNM